MPAQHPGEHRNEFSRDGELAHFARTEVDRGREIQQEPRRDVAVLVVLAHVRRVETRGHVPVDVPHVVVVLILAQIREVETEPPEERAIVAVQQPVETADHRPLEPPQDELRIARRIGTGHGLRAVFPARGLDA